MTFKLQNEKKSLPTSCILRFFINYEADSTYNSTPSIEHQVGLITLKCYLQVLHSHLEGIKE